MKKVLNHYCREIQATAQGNRHFYFRACVLRHANVDALQSSGTAIWWQISYAAVKLQGVWTEVLLGSMIGSHRQCNHTAAAGSDLNFVVQYSRWVLHGNMAWR